MGGTQAAGGENEVVLGEASGKGTSDNVTVVR